jgi:DNA-binding GntR family transcriptional regulator
MAMPDLEPSKRGRSARKSAAGDVHGKPPDTASEYVTRKLRARILDGSFPSSTHLDQQILADEMGVSIIPVREGLRRLEADGLVEILPRRGAFVAGLTRDELVEISRIRECLEDLAVRIAAPNTDGVLLDQLTDLNDRMAHLTARARPAQWFEMNRDWHFRLYNAAGADLLVQMIGVLWDKSSLYRLSNAARDDNRVKAVAEHADVIDRLRAGDAVGAARSVRHHIRRAAQDMFAKRAPGADQ